MSNAIESVLVVDDNPTVRETYEYSLEEAHLAPVPEAGPLGELETYVEETIGHIDAVICDHHLKVKDYAPYNGAPLVAAYYRHHVPAILCTRWAKASGFEIASYRSQIPVLLTAERLNPDSIMGGFRVCSEEFAGRFQVTRRPWRSLVRVEDVVVGEPDEGLFVTIPAWNPGEVVHLPVSLIPEGLLKDLGSGTRLYAQVNLGAESYEELYFQDWVVG